MINMSDSVELLGVDIPVKTGENPELIDRSLELVEEKIESIETKAPQASRLQVALLTALNLAGELTAAQIEDQPEGLSDELLNRFEQVQQKLNSLEEDN